VKEDLKPFVRPVGSNNPDVEDQPNTFLDVRKTVLLGVILAAMTDCILLYVAARACGSKDE
jgi:hypothetical protein